MNNMEDQPLINPSIDMNIDTNRPVDISDEEKEQFFKSILSDQPYEETTELFDGQLKVRFKSMSVQENTDVVNQIVADKKNGVAADNDAYFITISTYRLGLSIVHINGSNYSDISKQDFKPANETDTYVIARAKQMTSWPTVKLSVMLDAFSKFENKLIRLTNEAQNPNFWKASV